MSATPPTDRKYLESHEWHLVAGETATIGITQIAADELTDITYVSLPKVGAKVSAGKPFGEIESVKATSDLYSGVSGEVVAVNDAAVSEPQAINEAPYDRGWLIRVRPDSLDELNSLMSAADYDLHVSDRGAEE